MIVAKIVIWLIVILVVLAIIGVSIALIFIFVVPMFKCSQDLEFDPKNCSSCSLECSSDTPYCCFGKCQNRSFVQNLITRDKKSCDKCCKQLAGRECVRDPPFVGLDFKCPS